MIKLNNAWLALILVSVLGCQTVPPYKQISFRIYGAVNSPGTYSIPSGATLEDAVNRAGGFWKEDQSLKERTTVSRIVNGEEVTFEVGFSESIEHADAITVIPHPVCCIAPDEHTLGY